MTLTQAMSANPVEDLDGWEFTVGTVLTAHGIRGELKVRDLHGEPRFFESGAVLCAVLPDGSRRRLTVRSSRVHQGCLLVLTAEVGDRTEAIALRNARLTVDPATRGPRSDGRPWDDEVIGLEVFTDAGESLGPVLEVLHYPAHDIYVTERALIPAVPEWVLRVDLSDGRILVKHDDGLYLDS